MHKLPRHGALADGGGNPLDRMVAHVAGHKNAGHAGLQPVWRAIQRPAARHAAIAYQVGPGQNKSTFISLYETGHPISTRHSADEDEQRGRRHGLHLLGYVVGKSDRFQAGLAAWKRSLL